MALIERGECKSSAFGELFLQRVGYIDCTACRERESRVDGSARGQSLKDENRLRLIAAVSHLEQKGPLFK